MKEKAKEVLKLSLLSNPLNWSCWLALGEFCDKPSMLLELASSFPPSLGLECWKVHELNNLHASPESVLPILDKLAEHTPKSQFLGIQRAILYHNARDFDEAELLFENLQKSDPYLIDAMDLYSNVLYVRRNFAKLCDLAHTMSMTDRFRSETCICIGK
jgi:anaphase-promoting complex subunit 8